MKRVRPSGDQKSFFFVNWRNRSFVNPFGNPQRVKIGKKMKRAMLYGGGAWALRDTFFSTFFTIIFIETQSIVRISTKRWRTMVIIWTRGSDGRFCFVLVISLGGIFRQFLCRIFVSLRAHEVCGKGLTLFIFWPVTTSYEFPNGFTRGRFLHFMEKMIFVSPEGLALFIFCEPYGRILWRWKTQTVSAWPHPLHFPGLFSGPLSPK